MYVSYVVFSLLAATAAKCNGLEDLCDLRINQATFPGSHNAGSGFDGLLYYWSGGSAISCFYRNHCKSFSEQLAFGIRYFDIDTCYGTNEALNCHCPGKAGEDCAYAGSIEKGLKQIDGWMKSNPNEVVIIHFNHDSQEGYRQKIAKSIEAVLLKLWSPNIAHELAMNSYYKRNHKWPTLKEAVTSNRRILIFMHNGLAEHLPEHTWLVKSNYIIASTWDTVKVTFSCSAIVTNAKTKCGDNAQFIDLSAFGSYGLCTWKMAALCSDWLGVAQEACYQKRKVNGKTVNFLLVDWMFNNYESVVNKAKFMNQKNIKQYLGRDIFFPELQGCSYNAAWFYNYCWKFCPKYGWCWSNQYCGNNANVCKQKSYSCYGSCG